MPPLRLRDLKIGALYLEPLSGYVVRVRDFTLAAGTDRRVRAQVVYHNPITGLLASMEVFDHELEEVREPQDERYLRPKR